MSEPFDVVVLDGGAAAGARAVPWTAAVTPSLLGPRRASMSSSSGIAATDWTP
jgi:hypothetical protein